MAVTTRKTIVNEFPRMRMGDHRTPGYSQLRESFNNSHTSSRIVLFIGSANRRHTLGRWMERVSRVSGLISLVSRRLFYLRSFCIIFYKGSSTSQIQPYTPFNVSFVSPTIYTESE